MQRSLTRWLSGLALLLVSSAAMALGLGEIRVKSQPGQTLLAEIPVISSDPAEMERLQARLASPDTFERVGLQRPAGLVSELNFVVGVSDDGKPIIRVTSAVPVRQDAVNFLIEVDWGQGRLVREYTALVNAPGTVATVNEPAVQTPAPAPSNEITRVFEAPQVATEPLAPETAPATESTPAPVPEAKPVSRPPAPPPSVAPMQSGDAQTMVRRGQTLSQIAANLHTGQSLDQTMLALLRANPEAFINGNINLLKQGAVLRTPSSDELNQLSRAQANAMVSQQIAEWRQARRPVQQPLTAAAPTKSSEATRKTAPARLEIAPAAADATKRKGTTSGVHAGGEGNMLENTQLQQAKEDLVSRESEVQELHAQVAELEKIKQQQEKLIALKDSDLAAAQQHLAQLQPNAGSSSHWLWIGLVLLVAGFLAGWLLPRKRKDKEKPVSRLRLPDTPAAPVFPAVAGAPKVVEVKVESAETWKPLSPHQPTWHTGSGVDLAPLNAAPAGRQRLELAIAYLKRGDKSTARSLLNEVLAGNDADARMQAAQLLAELDY
jgi:pilus assembly protein FimV